MTPLTQDSFIGICNEYGLSNVANLSPLIAFSIDKCVLFYYDDSLDVRFVGTHPDALYYCGYGLVKKRFKSMDECCKPISTEEELRKNIEECLVAYKELKKDYTKQMIVDI